jgi:hypothetical protein
MRGFRVFSCFALMGCASTNNASTPATPAASPQESVRLSGGYVGTTTIDTHPITTSERTTVAYPVARVWSAMKPVYDSLGIPITTMDPATHTIGNTSMRIRRRLGDVAMSKYVNCGNVQGIQGADAYEVVASVVTRLEASDSPAGTRLLTSVDAQGRPLTISSEYVRCTSTGVLESRIGEIAAALAKR